MAVGRKRCSCDLIHRHWALLPSHRSIGPCCSAGKKLSLIHICIEVLLDDRDERVGVKFKDMELIGIPYRVTVGRGSVDGKVELVVRADGEKKELSVDACKQEMKELLTK